MRETRGTIGVRLRDWQNPSLRAEILGLLRYSDQRLVDIAVDAAGEVVLTLEEGANCDQCGMPVTPARLGLGAETPGPAFCSRCGRRFSAPRVSPPAERLDLPVALQPEPVHVNPMSVW